MTKGIFVFARNNAQVDYVKQAVFLAIQAKKHLNIPTTIATDAVDYTNTFPKVFDNIISVPYREAKSNKRYYDGTLKHKYLEFKNDDRLTAFELSPYDETLMLDTDIIINNSKYLNCFKSMHDLLLYRDAYDLAGFRDYSEFDKVCDTGVDFYWATCVFFRKTDINQIFFQLTKTYSR